MEEIAKPNVVVRVSEFANSSTQPVEIELPPGCTVSQLKELIAEKYERKPAPSLQRVRLFLLE
jgi:hypothetical protein